MTTLIYVNSKGEVSSHDYGELDLNRKENFSIVFDLSPATLTDGCQGLISITNNNYSSKLTINFGNVYLSNGPLYAATLTGSYVADDSYVLEYTGDNACTSLDLTGVTELPETLPWLEGTNRVAFVKAGSGHEQITNVVTDTLCQSLKLQVGRGDFRPVKSFKANTASLTCTVNGLQMLVLPFNAAVPEQANAYLLNDDLTLQPVTTITAHQPVLIGGFGEMIFMGSGEVAFATSPLDARYRGTYTQIPLYKGDYVLGRQDGVWGFIRLAEDAALSPFDVYAQYDSSEAFLPIDLSTTGISDRQMTQKTIPSATYNLMGQRVSGQQRGLLINNGKIIFKR